MERKKTVRLMALLVVAVSCTKGEPGPAPVREASDGRITLRPLVGEVSPWGLKGTKGMGITRPTESDSTLNAEFSVYTSAYYTDTVFTSASGNFFTGVKFDRTASGDWDTGTPIYWPADTGGNGLDFLAVATDTTVFRLSRLATWAGQKGFLHGEKNVHGVRIQVPAGNDSTEILYATASRKCGERNAVTGEMESVRMDFRHTQCCLEFNVRADLDSIVRLNKIYVKDAYTTGVLTVLTHPMESVEWDVRASEPHAASVPGVIDATPVTTSETLRYSMVLLPQERRDIVLSFRQVSADPSLVTPVEASVMWDLLSVEAVYTTTTESLKWEAGKKYVFDVTVKPGEIVVAPHVVEWTDADDVPIPV